MGISKGWKDTVNRAKDDARWDEYDDAIKKEVLGYQARLGKTPKFASPDPNLIRAMLWSESGGPDNPAWKIRPMQIGNKGDPAYAVIKGGKEGSSIIMDPAFASAIKNADINTPSVNIKAGIAYLYTRMAKFATKSIRDKDAKAPLSYTVVSGDSYSKIAKKNGTTVDELKASNPGVKPTGIKPGDTLKYYKAKMTLVITGWEAFNSKTVARLYNGGGDVEYAAKLDYIFQKVFPNLVRKTP